jgi:hypothetical protein
MLTFDSARKTFDSAGVPLGRRVQTHDGRTVDSTGAFLVGELERLDRTLNLPLVEISYTRDIDIREDVSIGDNFSSYTLSQVASAGSLGTGNGIGNGKAWIATNSTQLTGVSVDIEKIPTPLTLYGIELKYTIPELESAAQLGRPIDQQKFEAMELKHQMDIDEQVYVGDTTLRQFGLLNNPNVAATALPNGADGTPQWRTKTPDEILLDFNQMLTTTWANSGWKIKPNRIALPPAVFGYIATAKVATAAGNMSIKRYLEENNLLTSNGNQKLEIVDLKWCNGAAAGGTIGVDGLFNRALCYTKDYKYVRFPMTQLQRTPVQYSGIWHLTTYFCRLGAVEMPYSETISYWDNI